MGYLFAGYAVIWIIIFGYTLMVGRRQSNIEKEVMHLKRLLK